MTEGQRPPSCTKDSAHSIDFERFLYFNLIYIVDMQGQEDIESFLCVKTCSVGNVLNDESYF